ncbi:hypothetical protein Taro_010201 [Colocasia esculenta]|uniref:Uncharacterized protein n=1 Tax=Colocasia esculenta TaxID=4460 RepID=A0A843U6C4_COLES|nr:hypothetical protein [Colocasia esculenta]
MLNRSFRGRDKGGAATSPVAQKQPQQRGRTLGAVMKDKDEDLTLFLEMRKREKECQHSLLLSSNATDDLEPPPGSKPGSAPLFKIVSSAPTRRTGADDFLSSDSEKNDYDWLLTPPGTPLFPSLEKETQRSPIGRIGTPKNHSALLKSRLANPQVPPARGNSVSRSPTVSSSLSSGAATRRPASSSGPGPTSSRPATPTGQLTVPVTSKASRPSTPTSRAAIPSKPVVPPKRTSTPATRSATPTSRPSIGAPNKAPLRPTTPARRPSTPSAVTSTSAPPARSGSMTRSATSTVKSSVPSRGTSPTVRSRPWKPSDMPGFSLDAPPNLRTSMPERPSSASRGRPGAPTSRSSSVEAGPSGRPRRQSCSPSRGRAPNGVAHSRSSVPAVSRSHVNDTDNVSPVVMGSKMVERVVNVRRLAPPKQDNGRSTYAGSGGKSAASPDSSGFGRTLSKKSLDMALRHMDIRRSIPSSLRPLMTNIPASSMYSVRSGPTRSRTVSVSDSPLATSSNASSEQSLSNHNFLCLDGSELEDDDLASVKGVRSSGAGPLAR